MPYSLTSAVFSFFYDNSTDTMILVKCTYQWSYLYGNIWSYKLFRIKHLLSIKANITQCNTSCRVKRQSKESYPFDPLAFSAALSLNTISMNTLCPFPNFSRFWTQLFDPAKCCFLGKCAITAHKLTTLALTITVALTVLTCLHIHWLLFISFSFLCLVGKLERHTIIKTMGKILKKAPSHP